MEKVQSLERKTTPSRTEAVLGIIEDGYDVRPDDFVSAERIRGVFECLREIHLALDNESISEDPSELLQMLQETNTICKKLRIAPQTYAMASAAAQFANMDTSLSPDAQPSPWSDTIPSYLPPADLPDDRQMPPEYYETFHSLMSATYATLDKHAPSLYDPEIGKTLSAATHVSDNLAYGGHIQRELLKRIEKYDNSKKVLFEAYRIVASKVLLPTAQTTDGAYEDAQEALERLSEPTADDEPNAPNVPRRGNYIEGLHGVMAAAVTLRKTFPGVTADECVAFLYANASNLGEMTERFHSASPNFKNRGGNSSDDHDAALLLEDIEKGYYQIVQKDDGSHPELIIAELPRRDGEYPEEMFGPEGSAVRMRQEELIRRRRMHGGGCPARFKAQLPEGDIRKRITRFSESIKKKYSVKDPKIITEDGKLDTATLMIDRIIEAGERVGRPGRNLWTHGFEEYGVPTAMCTDRAL